MGPQYLIDTNAVIEFLGGALPDSAIVKIQNIVDQNLHHLSVINQIELLGFNGSTSEMQVLVDFVGASNILPLSEIVVQKTIDLRKLYKIKLPDAIIAATALSYDLILISRNISDFNKIPGLSCFNPHEKHFSG